MNQKQRTIIRELIKTYFKRDGKPLEITDGQCDIIGAVLNKEIKYLWISASTRYGKTECLALSLIILAVIYHLKIPIIAGSQSKANKIMEYILEHLADHPELYTGLLNLQGIKDIEKLKVSVSKSTLRWATGGWIYITSIDSRSISKEGEGAVGEGGDVVILEEAGLIKREEQFSKIVRMTEGKWGKLVMSGNCIEKSIFEKAYKSDLYHKVRISLEQSVKEGRNNWEDLNNKKEQTTSKDWKRFYLVEFPKAGEYAYFKPTKYEYLPKDLKYYGAYDPTIGETAKGSLAGIVVLGRSPTGQVYEVETIGKHLKPNEAIRTIFNLPYEFERFVIESVLFQKYLLRETQDKSKQEGRYIPFQGIHQSRNKIERIESLEPTINTKQILFKGDNELWREMQEYPEVESLDCLDALEMAWRSINKRFIGFA